LSAPTLARIKAANKDFFTQLFGQDRMIGIAKEGDTWVLKIQTERNTQPVYAITDETLKLVFLRHGW